MRFLRAGLMLTAAGLSTLIACRASEEPQNAESDVVAGGLPAGVVSGKTEYGLAAAVSFAPHGRTVVVECTRSADVIVKTFLADGRPDPDLSGGTIEFLLPGTTRKLGAHTISGAIEDDGSVILFGSINTTEKQPDGAAETYRRQPVIARLTPKGTLDPSFNETGYRLWPNHVGGIERIFVERDANGRTTGYDFLLANYGVVDGPQDRRLQRMDASGKSDPTYGQDGTAFTAEYDPIVDRPPALTPMSGGGFVTAQQSTTSASRVEVRRVDAAGKIDAAFGGDGIADFDLGAVVMAHGVFGLDDGTTLVNMVTVEGKDAHHVGHLGRLGTKGEPVDLFPGETGRRTDYLYAMPAAVLPDGRFLARGYEEEHEIGAFNTRYAEYSLERWSKTGVRDERFADDGRSVGYVNAIQALPDGSYMLARNIFQSDKDPNHVTWTFEHVIDAPSQIAVRQLPPVVVAQPDAAAPVVVAAQPDAAAPDASAGMHDRPLPPEAPPTPASASEPEDEATTQVLPTLPEAKRTAPKSAPAAAPATYDVIPVTSSCAQVPEHRSEGWPPALVALVVSASFLRRRRGTR